MSVLVTGGGGFVGINVVEALLATGRRVVLLDRIGLPALVQSRISQNAPQFHVVAGDVRDRALLGALFRDHGIDEVIHAAVITAGMQRESEDPDAIIDVNVRGTASVLRAAKEALCRRFVYVSSGQAYGATHDEGVRLEEEVSASRPNDLYGITKFAAEQMVIRLADLWRMSAVCTRLGSVCGPWEFDTGVRDMLSPQLQVARLALRGVPAVLPRRQVWRDWIYSRDVADALVAVLDAPHPRHGVYHLSSGIDWRGSFERLCGRLQAAYPRFSWRHGAEGEAPNVDFVVQRDRAPMAISRLVTDIGFRPRFGPDEAYADYVNWIRDHEEFIAAGGAGATPGVPAAHAGLA